MKVNSWGFLLHFFKKIIYLVVKKKKNLIKGSSSNLPIHYQGKTLTVRLPIACKYKNGIFHLKEQTVSSATRKHRVTLVDEKPHRQAEKKRREGKKERCSIQYCAITIILTTFTYTVLYGKITS